ncbi:uncharacterized protein LTR77_007523 [Saxophila tyrrhenica]|uniref:Uncharacterized protein n=1 Tax=Saxophila tyrrhenica TaxID=1690608 RepID=A0AAV9P7X1_9PEZI|nr:hypothetical protein LTR77_007523 [Saxophila tyrrhenica]
MPDFASSEYWEARFEKNKSTFDWLVPAKVLSNLVRDAVDETRLLDAEVLHAGCGTAESSAIRELVNDPGQIHNVDYSQAAIDAAYAREQELLKEKDSGFTDDLLEAPTETADKRDSVRQIPLQPPPTMRWSCFDLRSLDHILYLLQEQRERGRLFDVVIDKSTSDSIACGTAVPIRLPYVLSIDGWTRGILHSGYAQAAEVHPLHVLAVHMAALTKPRTGKWIVVSYSEDRFPFFPPYPKSVSHGFLPDDVLKAGFPHPKHLWRLETKEKIDVYRDESLAERKKRLASGVVHRPEVPNWLTEALVSD